MTNEALAILASLGGDDVSVTPAPSSWPCQGALASVAKSKSVVIVGFDPWSELPMLALWIHRAVASTQQGPGGATLVVVNDSNGLHRDTKRWIKTNGDVKRGLASLIDDVEKRAGAGADLQARPSTLLFSEELARDPEARPLLEKLAALLEADGTAGLVGAPSPFVNGRGAGEILGTSRAGTKSGYQTVVVVGHAHVDSAAVGNARGVWMVHSLPAENIEIPAWVDVVLPLAHPYEQSGSFTNLEGRVQAFDAAGIAPTGAKSDWEALAALSRELGSTLPSQISALRELLSSTHATFKNIPRSPNKRLAVL